MTDDSCILLKLRQEGLVSVIALVEKYSHHKPDFHHGHHIPSLFQLADLVANLCNRLMPADEYLILGLDVKVGEPLPNCMSLGIITTFDGLQQVLDLALGNALCRVVTLFESNVATQRIQRAHSGFNVVNAALMILQQRAAHLVANRLQANNRHTGVVSDMSLAVLCKELGRRQLQFLGHLVDVHRTQNDILTVEAAHTTARAMELKGVVQTTGHVFNISSKFIAIHS